MGPIWFPGFGVVGPAAHASPMTSGYSSLQPGAVAAPQTRHLGVHGQAGTIGIAGAATMTSASQLGAGACIDESARTTVMLRNLPCKLTRALLIGMLERKGFGEALSFLYLPIDFRKKTALGYAFVDLVHEQLVDAFWGAFDGIAEWPIPSENVCSVSWCDPHQGPEAHIERYRNSPVMHDSVPDSYKPVLLKDGRRIPFPKPTQGIRFPRLRDRKPGRS